MAFLSIISEPRTDPLRRRIIGAETIFSFPFATVGTLCIPLVLGYGRIRNSRDFRTRNTWRPPRSNGVCMQLHEAAELKEAYTLSQSNTALKDGWKLLAVVCGANGVTYVLGKPKPVGTGLYGQPVSG